MTSVPQTLPVVAVVGATATGKSALAVRLALALGGEVVNADSMQLYRGMDIGTAKPTPAECLGVPHHVLDVWPVTATASVAEYQVLARAAMADIAHRARVPILTGGSGLYIGAALDDLRFPGTDPAARVALEAEAARLGPQAMHDRLVDVDPQAATAIEPGNVRRVIRALEVIGMTGRPFAATLPRDAPYAVPAVAVGLRREPGDLDRRIESRVGAMFDAGLVAEVHGLLGDGLRSGPTASRALGYAQVLAALDAVPGLGAAAQSSPTLAAAAAATVTATRRFARRQQTWFRRDSRITWFDAADPHLDDRVLTHVRSLGVAVAS